MQKWIVFHSQASRQGIQLEGLKMVSSISHSGILWGRGPCNPKHASSEVHLIEFNGTYSQVSVFPELLPACKRAAQPLLFYLCLCCYWSQSQPRCIICIIWFGYWAVYFSTFFTCHVGHCVPKGISWLHLFTANKQTCSLIDEHHATELATKSNKKEKSKGGV